MAKPSKSSEERNLFTEIDLQIMLRNEKIKNHRRSIEKAKKLCGWYGPKGAGSVQYSQEPGSHNGQISFLEGLTMIQKDEERIRLLQEEKKELQRSRRRIRRIYESLTGYEERVFYLRVISQKTQAAAAEEMSISLRQFQRIESGMKEKGLI